MIADHITWYATEPRLVALREDPPAQFCDRAKYRDEYRALVGILRHGDPNPLAVGQHPRGVVDGALERFNLAMCRRE